MILNSLHSNPHSVFLSTLTHTLHSLYKLFTQNNRCFLLSSILALSTVFFHTLSYAFSRYINTKDNSFFSKCFFRGPNFIHTLIFLSKSPYSSPTPNFGHLITLSINIPPYNFLCEISSLIPLQFKHAFLSHSPALMPCCIFPLSKVPSQLPTPKKSSSYTNSVFTHILEELHFPSI